MAVGQMKKQVWKNGMSRCRFTPAHACVWERGGCMSGMRLKIADILLELSNFIPDMERYQIFQCDSERQADAKYSFYYCDFSFETGKVTERYHCERFAEYEDAKNRYRVFVIQLNSETGRVIVKWKKEESEVYEILLEKAFRGRYPQYFDFLNHLAFENLLLRHGGILLHASVVSYQGQGILFSAASGVGKSTQADLWKRYMQADIINGDRAAVRKKEGAFWAFGSPMAGSSGIYKNTGVRIKALIILAQADKNIIRRMGEREAFAHLYRETLVNVWDREFVEKTVDLIREMVETVPVYRLSCRPDKEAVELLKQVCFAEEK